MAKEKLPTINIKGKEYVTVAQRILAFNELYENGMIETEVSYLDEKGAVRARAKVTPDVDKPNRYFIGHSEELRTSTGVNQTSATENCETSAIGRALGMMGIGVIEAIASVDEITKAQNQEKTQRIEVVKESGDKKLVDTIHTAISKATTPAQLDKIILAIEASKKLEADVKETLTTLAQMKLKGLPQEDNHESKDEVISTEEVEKMMGVK